MSYVLLQVGAVKQRGLVLLALVIIIALTFISYVLSDISINQIRNEQVTKTQVSLKKAKQALINYAVSHMDRVGDEGEMGFLPCPDVGTAQAADEGQQDTTCGTQYRSSLGYLPWKALDISSLRDSNGNCLLYAVSNTYKLNPTNLLNDDSNGMFQVIDAAGNTKLGVLPQDRAVAIVFAPGKPLPVLGQARNFTVGTDCGMDYTMSSFLDRNGLIDNSDLSAADNAIDRFILMTATSNDNFLTITRDDIWQAILARKDFIPKMSNLTEALAFCLVEFSKANSDRRLPWPSPMDVDNNNYRNNSSYDDKNGGLYAGRYPYRVDDTNTALGKTSPGPNIFDNCESLSLKSGTTINLKNTALEYSKLWENWKDHFFYILSKEYKPGTGGEKKCGDCNKVGATEYSAIVIFSGTRFGPDLRADGFGGDDDDKANIINYIENGNDLIFIAADGKDDYQSVGLPADSNDIMFCVTDEDMGDQLDVDPC